MSKNIKHNDMIFQYDLWLDYSVGIAATMFNRDRGSAIICFGYHPDWVNLDINPKGIRQLVLTRDGIINSTKWNESKNIWEADTSYYPTRILVPSTP